MKTTLSSCFTRRRFIKTAVLSAVAADFAGPECLNPIRAQGSVVNPLPRWRGFNLVDFNSPDPQSGRRGTNEDELKWMVDWGFDFIRLPMAYPRYVNFDRSKHIAPADVYNLNEQEVARIEAFVRKAQALGLHVCLNLHRAPGYCINAGFFEPYNLWDSNEAQAAFFFHWGMWGKRFKDLSPSKISFDLLNEPALRADMNDQHGAKTALPGDLYRKVAKGATEASAPATPVTV